MIANFDVGKGGYHFKQGCIYAAIPVDFVCTFMPMVGFKRVWDGGSNAELT